MKKIVLLAVLGFITSLAAAQNRVEITKCLASIVPPTGWVMVESTDNATGAYTCTFSADTSQKPPTAILFTEPMNLKTMFIDTNVVDAKSFCNFFAKEFPNMAADYKSLAPVKEITLDGRKLYVLEYNLSKDGIVSHFLNYFYDAGMATVAIISVIDKEATFKSNLRTLNAAIGSIKFK